MTDASPAGSKNAGTTRDTTHELTIIYCEIDHLVSTSRIARKDDIIDKLQELSQRLLDVINFQLLQ